MNARYLIGDVFDVMATLPDASVDLVCTSPPFLALRSYLPADHPDKGKEIGSEPTPAAFLDTMLALTAEWGRLLAPHGSIAVELGDTYSGSGGAGGDYGDQGMRDGQPKFGGSAGRRNRPADVAAGTAPPQKRPGPEGRDTIAGWPMDKSLALIPQLYAVALSYGINPLTGEASPAGRWRVRNVVRWCRPNPPVGALGDKYRPATSEMVIATRSRTRYFDLDAVREPYSEGTLANNRRAVSEGRFSEDRKGDKSEVLAMDTWALTHAGAPPLDWWEIPTHPYKGSHYATWPPDLLVRPVKSMVPERVCRVCGEPSRRIVGEAEYVNSKTGEPVTTLHFSGERRADGENHWDTTGQGDRAATRVAPTLGWSDCGHDDYRNGIVLDPFAGSGTTLMVATGHGRDAIGIDLDSRNADLARERVGMFLKVEGDDAACATCGGTGSVEYEDDDPDGWPGTVDTYDRPCPLCGTGVEA